MARSGSVATGSACGAAVLSRARRKLRIRIAAAGAAGASRGVVEVNARHVAVFAGSHYRYIDNVPDESPFAGIEQLPAASFVELRGQRLQVDRYWSLDQQPEWTENEATLAERYRELLREAVGSRLKAARKPVFTLSGGMDSSSVLACAVDIAGERSGGRVLGICGQDL